MVEIKLGCGKVMVGSVRRKEDGVEGLLFKPTGEEHCIDTKDPNWKKGEDYHFKDDDVVI